MKREHAVLIIAESLIEPNYPDDAMKEANHILKRLEKAGMKPPRFYDSNDDSYGEYWETEDETK